MTIPKFETFHALEGDEFRVKPLTDPGTDSASYEIDLTLKSAKLLGIYKTSEKEHENFSLTFVGPIEQPASQGIFTFENSDLGSVSLFMVPISKTGDGIEYEVIIDHAIASD